MKAIKVFKNAYLIDGTGRPPVKNASVIVDGSTIKAAGKGLEIPASAEVIDVGGETLMPGMIDSHCHLYSVDDPTELNYPSYASLILSLLKATPSMLTLYAAKNAKKMLESGFTGARDLAGFTNWDNLEIVALRKAQELGIMLGPRIVAAGWIAPTGGSGALPDIAGNLKSSWMLKLWSPDSPNPAADGVLEVKKRVRHLALKGLDQIKTVASGEVHYSQEELDAITNEAHAAGKKVAVHATDNQSIKRALKAGADTIEHCSSPDDEAIKMLKQRRAIAVPTLSVRDKGLEYVEEWLGESAARARKKERERMAAHDKECFKKMVEAGVRIACGTDTYTILCRCHGENASELELMVRYGMTEMQAIVAATKTASEALGLEDKIGTIEKGKTADLIVVRGDPLKDIKLLQKKENIRIVMQDGNIIINREARRQNDN